MATSFYWQCAPKVELNKDRYIIHWAVTVQGHATNTKQPNKKQEQKHKQIKHNPKKARPVISWSVHSHLKQVVALKKSSWSDLDAKALEQTNGEVEREWVAVTLHSWVVSNATKEQDEPDTREALLSEAGFEKTQNWVRRSKLFCRWFCFLLGQAGCFFSSVAADLALRLGPDSERSGKIVRKKYETLWLQKTRQIHGEKKTNKNQRTATTRKSPGQICVSPAEKAAKGARATPKKPIPKSPGLPPTRQG